MGHGHDHGSSVTGRRLILSIIITFAFVLGEAIAGYVSHSLALTAYARAEDRMRVLRSGYRMHVPKPVEPAELVAVVANLAGRHEEG